MAIIFSLALAGFFAALGIVLACDHWISIKAKNYHFSQIEELPKRETAVILGCSEKLANGRDNLFFKYRIEAAVALYRAGKCDHIIVSGDNSRSDYDEPAQMKRALTRLGVPANRVQADCAGFRTLDSIVRANAIFDQSDFIVVSQKFHNERAIYIAQQKRLGVIGFDARDVSRSGGIRTRLRECLARVKTLLDVHVLSTEPKFLGPGIALTQNQKN